MKINQNMQRFSLFLLAWFGVEVFFALSDLLPKTQLATGTNIVLGVGLALVLTFSITVLRQVVMNVPLQLLLGLQAIRFFGALFLAYSGKGLDPMWAFWAGWIDIAVAASAIFAAWRWCPPNTPSRRTALWIWSIIGIVDIIAAPVSAILLRALYPETMTAILQWPLRIVPLFFVPLMIYLHIIIIVRLLEVRKASKFNSYKTYEYAT